MLTPPGMSAVVMLELGHEKLLANAAVASRMFPVETCILCDTTGPVVDSGQRRVWD